MDGFGFFDAIAYILPAAASPVGDRVRQRFGRLGIADRVEHVPAVATPGDRRVGVLLTHRGIVQAASMQGARSVLVLSGDVHFLDRTHDILAEATAGLARLQWSLCYLGGWWPIVLEPEPTCRHLARARDVTNAHAVAYSERVYPRILADWPVDASEGIDWVVANGEIDTYLGKLERAVVVQPVVTTVPALLPFEAAASQPHFAL